MIDLILNQIPGFVSGVLVTVFGGYLLFMLTKRKERECENQKNKNDFLILKKRVIEECDFNITPGVGDARCNFQFEAHKILLNHPLASALEEKILPLTKDIIHSAALCNSYGGLMQLEKPPGIVKNMSNDLKNLLLKTEVS
jgi:hypothetical protein